ncbi:MAG: formylglycine-generating enzyme family protein, partial [Candidatus Sumerlaeota bacterium]|nr:formylglycine-generating enzyme family protein [Candidatus Sumerlaeota bacterium]
VVSNGRASQRADGSGMVDVFYDLSGATSMTHVAVVFSPNGGVDYMIIPKTQWLSGDVGPVTNDGLNKQIVWDAGKDLPGVRYEQARAKVIALDGEFVLLPGGVPLEMVAVPAGSFQMGSNDPGWSASNELPAHTVNIGYSFKMSKFEVTQRQWVALMETNPSTFTGNDMRPVEQVSWNDIRGTNGFLDKLNQHITATGQGPATFRLPSESEWEYACRAGSQTRFCFGNSDCAADSCNACNLGDYAWYCGNAGGTTHEVGGKLPNAFGLFDMHGNVYEWCEDWYHDSYTGAPADGSAWVTPVGSYRVLRGGLCNLLPRYCRSADRLYFNPDSKYTNYGFRVVR